MKRTYAIWTPTQRSAGARVVRDTVLDLLFALLDAYSWGFNKNSGRQQAAVAVTRSTFSWRTSLATTKYLAAVPQDVLQRRSISGRGASITPTLHNCMDRYRT